MTPLCLSYDDAIDWAYEQFLAVAPQHLDSVDMILLAAQFEERGAAEIATHFSDWSSSYTGQISTPEFVQVDIGLINLTTDKLDDIFAQVLVDRRSLSPTPYFLWSKN